MLHSSSCILHVASCRLCCCYMLRGARCALHGSCVAYCRYCRLHSEHRITAMLRGSCCMLHLSRCMLHAASLALHVALWRVLQRPFRRTSSHPHTRASSSRPSVNRPTPPTYRHTHPLALQVSVPSCTADSPVLCRPMRTCERRRVRRAGLLHRRRLRRLRHNHRFDQRR